MKHQIMIKNLIFVNTLNMATYKTIWARKNNLPALAFLNISSHSNENPKFIPILIRIYYA
jgi:hypothetical protein